MRLVMTRTELAKAERDYKIQQAAVAREETEGNDVLPIYRDGATVYTLVTFNHWQLRIDITVEGA